MIKRYYTIVSLIIHIQIIYNVKLYLQSKIVFTNEVEMKNTIAVLDLEIGSTLRTFQVIRSNGYKTYAYVSSNGGSILTAGYTAEGTVRSGCTECYVSCCASKCCGP